MKGSKCPAGELHYWAPGTSSNYQIYIYGGEGNYLQGNWRYCNKCKGLFYAGYNLGVCPMGETHSKEGSGDYFLNYGKIESAQDQGRYCKKCQGLFWNGGRAQGVCPAGGGHDRNGKGEYWIRTEELMPKSLRLNN